MKGILQEIMKKNSAWSMRQSSHRPSDQAYDIEDCRILGESLACVNYWVVHG